jgi:hypothetical protein
LLQSTRPSQADLPKKTNGLKLRGKKLPKPRQVIMRLPDPPRPTGQGDSKGKGKGPVATQNAGQKGKGKQPASMKDTWKEIHDSSVSEHVMALAV